MKALVTGGAGFIGSNLVDALLDGGHTVAVIDNLTTGRMSNLETAVARGVEFHEVDVTDEGAVAGVMAAATPEVIFHLAAQIDVRRAVEEPVFDASVNIGGTVVMLEAARRGGVSNFVLASTGGAIYGDADVLPTPESAPVAPQAPYGVSKAAAESYCTLYSSLHNLPTTCLRLANVYGPRQDPLGEAGVVAIFCSASTNGSPVVIFGDGRQTRDFVYVGDVAQAFMRAGESSLGGTFNIGTGVQTSIVELAEVLALEPTFEAARAGEVEHSCLSSDAAAAALGFTSQTALEEGLALTVASAI